MPRLLSICLCLAAAAPTAATAEEDHDHVFETAGVRILHAWTNAGEGPDARVYMEIENAGDVTQTLTGGESTAARVVTLVGTSIRAGDAAANPIDAIPIQPQGELALEPGGLFLLLEGVEAPLVEGEAFHVEVILDPAGHVEVEVQVEDEDATAHSHAGHSH